MSLGDRNNLAKEFAQNGRFWLRNFLPEDAVKQLAGLCQTDGRPGNRPDYHPDMAQYLGQNSPLADVLTLLGVDAHPVRLASFYKTQETNWSVSWHQDRIIAVKNRADCEDYSNWTAQKDYFHCVAPLSTLSHMLFIRVHFDENAAENGAMQLALGSHRHGVVSAENCATIASQCETEICAAQAGDVLIVHGLMLHRSLSSQSSQSRHVLRVDYAKRDALDARLQWHIG